MNRDAVKITGAVVLLVVALGFVFLQVKGRLGGGGPTATWSPDPGVMDDEMETSEAPAERAVAEWTPPADGVAAAAAENPFLRPVNVRAPRKRPAAPSVRSKKNTSLVLSGIRIGENPTAIINDRILTEGDSVAGWRVVDIEWDRVTLRSSDGRTIRLAG